MTSILDVLPLCKIFIVTRLREMRIEREGERGEREKMFAKSIRENGYK